MNFRLTTLKTLVAVLLGIGAYFWYAGSFFCGWFYNENWSICSDGASIMLRQAMGALVIFAVVYVVWSIFQKR